MSRRSTTLLLRRLALLALVSRARPRGAGRARRTRPARRRRRCQGADHDSGTIEVTTDENGNDTYTLADGGTTYTLEAGPPWFFRNNHPLKPYVGQSVTVDGEVAEGGTEVDVVAVNGTALREPGKPPWAGGWKVVGERIRAGRRRRPTASRRSSATASRRGSARRSRPRRRRGRARGLTLRLQMQHMRLGSRAGAHIVLTPWPPSSTDSICSATGEWRNGRRAGLRSRCRVSGVRVRPPPRPPTGGMGRGARIESSEGLPAPLGR